MSKINTVCHKRSSVITEGVPKQPTTDQIDYGEIAINYAANGETLYIKNSENAIAEFKDNKYYQKQLSDKQDKLVSGTNIKTVNGESLLGDGNIFIPKVFIDDATDESVAIHSQESDILSSVVFVSPTTHTHFEYTKRSEIVNSLSSTDGTVPLSANQGKVLNDKFGGYIPITGGVADNVELFSNNGSETLIGNPENNSYVRIREDMAGVGDNWFIDTNGAAKFKNLTVNDASAITVTDVVDSLTSTGNDKPLSANQGRVLNEKKYEKPSNGIPMSDLNSAVQQSIECGDEAYASIRNGTIRAREALIQWGGQNNNEGNLSPIESLLTESANRLTFGNAEGVTVEYSTDG